MREYRMDSTLCRLAAIAISKHLWKHSPLKNTLKICLKYDEVPKNILPSDITDMMSQFFIPQSAKEELTFVVGMMGQEIWEFYSGLERRFRNFYTEEPMFTFGSSSWIEHICWTNHGCIDSPESIRSLYMSNILPENISTWMELCTHCLGDCLIDLFPKIPQMDRGCCWIYRLIIREDVEFDLILLTYWMGHLNNDLGRVIDVVRQVLPEPYDETYSFEENMFIYSFASRKDCVVEYFWGLLNDNQRRRVIANICEKIVSDNPSTQEFKDLFFSGNRLGVHLLIFFLQQLSSYGHDGIRIKILGSGFALKELLNWPYDNLFLKTFKESLTHHDSIDYNPIIVWLAEMICCCEYRQLIDRDFKYRRIFYQVWEMNLKNLKNSINYSEILSTLWSEKEIELLNYILEDKELRDRRKKLLNELVQIHEYVESDDDFTEIFIAKVLLSEEEREWFTAQIDLGLGTVALTLE